MKNFILILVIHTLTISLAFSEEVSDGKAHYFKHSDNTYSIQEEISHENLIEKNASATVQLSCLDNDELKLGGCADNHSGAFLLTSLPTIYSGKTYWSCVFNMKQVKINYAEQDYYRPTVKIICSGDAKNLAKRVKNVVR